MSGSRLEGRASGMSGFVSGIAGGHTEVDWRGTYLVYPFATTTSGFVNVTTRNENASGMANTQDEPEAPHASGLPLIREEPTPSGPSATEVDWTTVGGIGVGAIVGTIVRYFLAMVMSGPDGSGTGWVSGPIAANLLPNIAGCFIIGVIIAQRPQMKRDPSVYTAMTTGFCGCCTTFSAYTTSVALLWMRGSVWSAFLCAIIGTATSHAALKAGISFSSALIGAGVLPSLAGPAGDGDGGPRGIRAQLIVFWTALVAAGAAMSAALIHYGATWPVLGMYFAVPAAWARFFAGKQFNIPTGALPYGTLLANICAALIDAACATQTGGGGCAAQISGISLQVVQGISLGFCGGLSTVSTTADELRKLSGKSERRAWLYFMVTVLGGQAAAAVVLLPYREYYGCTENHTQAWWSA